MSWNAAQYLKFGGERTRPAAELAARVPLDAPKVVVDLGCGPGNSTAVLRARYPEARLIGVDNAPDMLEKALASGVKAEWVDGDAASWRPDGPVDLIYSNALFQWLDGHAEMFPRLMDMLTPGGVLAIQMPRNFDAPSHVLLRKTARQPRFRAATEGHLREDPVGSPEDYSDLLEPHATALDIWETTYAQRLAGEDAVLNWVKGTALVPVLAALESVAERAAFLADYGGRLATAYPTRENGVTLFPFRRIFIVAVK